MSFGLRSQNDIESCCIAQNRRTVIPWALAHMFLCRDTATPQSKIRRKLLSLAIWRSKAMRMARPKRRESDHDDELQPDHH